MTNINEITESIKSAIMADNERMGNVVFDALLNNVTKNVLPESIFSKYFLPCFLGLRNDQSSVNWMAEWVSVAGTAMSEVTIIDDNTKQPLFDVPPIFNTTALYLHKSEGDLGDIFARHRNISNNNPMAGLNFLISALNSKTIDLSTNIDHGGILDRWVAIIKRYGYLDNYKSVNPEDMNTAKQNLDDFLDF